IAQNLPCLNFIHFYFSSWDPNNKPCTKTGMRLLKMHAQWRHCSNITIICCNLCELLFAIHILTYSLSPLAHYIYPVTDTICFKLYDIFTTLTCFLVLLDCLMAVLNLFVDSHIYTFSLDDYVNLIQVEDLVEALKQNFRKL
ncbi:hypothetical protein ACJX0J_015436, partial [Zea mays]